MFFFLYFYYAKNSVKIGFQMPTAKNGFQALYTPKNMYVKNKSTRFYAYKVKKKNLLRIYIFHLLLLNYLAIMDRYVLQHFIFEPMALHNFSKNSFYIFISINGQKETFYFSVFVIPYSIFLYLQYGAMTQFFASFDHSWFDICRANCWNNNSRRKNRGNHDQLKLRPYFLPWVLKNRRYLQNT